MKDSVLKYTNKMAPRTQNDLLSANADLAGIPAGTGRWRRRLSPPMSRKKVWWLCPKGP